MSPDVRNPAFPRAIPHGMAIIDLLDRVVLFGLFSGCLRVLPWGGVWSSLWGRFRGVSESTFSGRSNANSHPKSSSMLLDL